MPLTARIAPSASRLAGRAQRVLAGRPRGPPSAPTSSSRGPAVVAGDRLGVEAAVAGVVVLAPGRRAHIGKSAMVVAARSYGRPVMIVNRGPQLVQVMNGWR